MVEVLDFFESTLAAKESFVGVVGVNTWELILYTVGIALYSVFIWHFHKFVAQRDVFKWEVDRHDKSLVMQKISSGFFYFFRYLLVYPIMVFLWFGIFATFMFVLGKSLPVENVLLVSFALVTAIRLTAYYSEALSHDLAKLIPLALLVVYVVQPTFFEFGVASDRIYSLANFWTDILKFTAFSVGAEWTFRILWSIKHRIAPDLHAPKEINDVRKVVERFGR